MTTTTRALLPDELLHARGPFVSLYLNTEAARAQGWEETSLRFKALRERATETGAPEDSLAVFEERVDRAHLLGDGLVLIVSGSSVVLERHLARPVADDITFGPAPNLVPLIEWEQANPSYAVVLADRTGAEIHVVHKQAITRSIEVERDLTKQDVAMPQPGGWSQARFQRRAENLWEANAKEVADELGRVAQAENLEFILVAGDVSAVRHLKSHAADNIGPLLIDIDVHPNDLSEIQDELEQALSAYVGQRIKDLLDKFQEERGQDDLATEGWERTMTALRMSQVGTLLISSDVEERSAFFVDADPNQCSADRGSLEGLGLGDVVEGPARDVVVRAALGTGADVRVIPSLGPEHGPRDSVGSLLRFDVRA